MAFTPNLGTYQLRPVASLKPYEKNARTHSAEQVEQLTRSIREFGFTNPLLIERMLRNSARPGDLVLDLFGGSGSTLMAAERLGMSARLSELDPGEAYKRLIGGGA